MSETYLCIARWQRYALRLLLILGCVITGNAYAHKANVFAYPEGDRVYVQGYFLDGKKVKNSKVTVYSGDKPFVEGLTNEEGEFTFLVTDKQDLRIVLDAGEGHQAEYRLSAAEVAGLQTASAQQPSANPAAATADAASPAATHAELRRAVAEGVMPLAREIAELKERRSVSDILGGIGFIVGVLGVFAYFQARRQRG